MTSLPRHADEPAAPEQLEEIARLVRYYALTMTTRAGSGHPTSAMSAVELMVGLLFGGIFRYYLDEPDHPNNDRLIFSKGHATPLFYCLWLLADRLTEEELMSYRRFGSELEGHPTPRFRYCEAATGSLGQGLAIGVGMALNAMYLDKLPYRTYVLLGDSEMAEGSQWEAIQLAAHYRLHNLVGIIDVNRLGQRGQTMYGHDLEAYQERVSAFGWATITIDGHSLAQVIDAYVQAAQVRDRPVMIIAKTIKGKGVSFLEDENGWHGRPVDEERLPAALAELGEVDRSVRGRILPPQDVRPAEPARREAGPIAYEQEKVATRAAYGNALVRIFHAFPRIVGLDGEVSNSTYAERLRDAHPNHFFEMFIAEQNMAGVALGLAQRGKIPFASSFSAFLSRAHDQIRMSQYSDANIKFVGSHAGTSIGEDGPSQMGLEDIAMFRSILGSVVLYPCDAVSTERLVELAAAHEGLVYIRTTRMGTPIIYEPDDPFAIGGSTVLRHSDHDAVTVVAAGITVHEALEAHQQLAEEGIAVRVIDLYSIKPLDLETLRLAGAQTRAVITVEDHYPEGGLGEAVASALADRPVPVHQLAVRKRPMSGTPQELLDYEGISAGAIAAKVRELVAEGVGA
ncbi:MAG: transketolase [Armatimonadota bacterium]